MKRNDYWRKREEEQLRHNLTEEAEIQKALAERYNYMLRQIEMQINDFYARYARREQITLAEAKQRVSKMDVQAFASKAKKYVEEKNFSAKANQELRLYNATMRINRLELLKANIGLEMIDAFNDIEGLMDDALTKRTIDELKRQEEILRRDAGILNTTVFDNAKTARSIVNASFNNATWSERIWGNQAQLKNELATLLTQGLIQGRNPRVLAPALRDRFGVSLRNAERLMVTELARVQTDAQKESFKRNDIDEYIFLSLDTACRHCMALNEKHFPVRDMMPGENAPPIHPRCRCSTAAYVDREKMEREVFEEPVGGKEEWMTIKDAQDEAARFLEKSFMDKTFKGVADFKGISPEHATRIVRALQEVYEMFPELKKLHGIKSVDPSSRLGKKAFKDGADALFSYDPVQGGIYINRSVLKDASFLADYFKRSDESWDFVMKNLDKLTGPQRELALKYKDAGRSLVAGNSIEYLFIHEMGHLAEWELYPAKVNNMLGSRMGQYAPKISGYANASKGEYLAESFTAYMKGEKKILDPELVKFLNGKTGKNKNTVFASQTQAVKEDISFTSKSGNAIIGTSRQIGRKIKTHAKDYGLDPSSANDRKRFIEITQDIIQNYTELRHGPWRSQPGECDFYIKGEDVVIVNGGHYVTTMKGGIHNARVKNARK